MNIKYNESEKTIEINDGLKMQSMLIKVMLILIVINAGLFPIEENLELMGILWAIIGLVSFVFLIYIFIKSSSAEKLKLSDISGLVEKQAMGKKKISLLLKNGKQRALIGLKNEADITEAKKLFKKLGIE